MYKKDKKNIKNLLLDEMELSLQRLDIPHYRAKQIFAWLYKKGCASFSDMTDLPVIMREILHENYFFQVLRVREKQNSTDGVTKYLFELEDSNFIETVVIKTKARKTLCISTQVGCKYGCAFCASGMNGFKRNLEPSEIVDQVAYVKVISGIEIDNYVFMGIGEPFDNYDNVIKAIRIMNSKDGLNIAARRITVSTNGIVPGIEEIKSFDIQVNLAISLHAVTQEKRKMLMPVASKYSLNQLIRACQHYYEQTNRMITLEYILLKNINDKREDALGLANIARDLKAKVNLIPCSPIYSSKVLRKPDTEDVDKFFNMLIDKHVNVTVRNSKGGDIKAACGQLAGLHQEQ